MIHRTHSQTTYTIPAGIPEGLKSIIKYGVESYGFVMSKREFTFGELAEAIRATYDETNPVNKRVINALEFAERWMEPAKEPYAGFNAEYELALKIGNARYGSACRHESVYAGRCTKCLRRVR